MSTLKCFYYFGESSTVSIQLIIMILLLPFKVFHFFLPSWYPMDEKIIFVIGDKLPRYYEAAIAKSAKTQKLK